MYLKKDRSKKALNRNEFFKARNRCIKYWHVSNYPDFYKDKSVHFKNAITPKPCSCWMCGNPRKAYKGRNSLYGSLTLKEYVANKVYNEIKMYLND